jgi:hypothetical protein
VEEKKKFDSEFLSYNIMLNSGKKIRALRDKKINILTLVLSEKKYRTFLSVGRPFIEEGGKMP